LNNVEKLKS